MRLVVGRQRVRSGRVGRHRGEWQTSGMYRVMETPLQRERMGCVGHGVGGTVVLWPREALHC